MSITIHKGKKGTMIKAHGKDAMALFESITRSTRQHREESNMNMSSNPHYFSNDPTQFVDESPADYQARMERLRNKKLDEEESSDASNGLLNSVLAADLSSLDTGCFTGDAGSSDLSPPDTSSSDFVGGGGDFGGGGSSGDF